MSGSNSDADLRDSDVAERLVASYAAESPLSITAGHELPSPREVHAALTDLRELLFPGAASDAACDTKTKGREEESQCCGNARYAERVREWCCWWNWKWWCALRQTNSLA